MRRKMMVWMGGLLAACALALLATCSVETESLRSVDGGTIAWAQLTGVPAGFADGVDNDTGGGDLATLRQELEDADLCPRLVARDGTRRRYRPQTSLPDVVRCSFGADEMVKGLQRALTGASSIVTAVATGSPSAEPVPLAVSTTMGRASGEVSLEEKLSPVALPVAAPRRVNSWRAARADDARSMKFTVIAGAIAVLVIAGVGWRMGVNKDSDQDSGPASSRAGASMGEVTAPTAPDASLVVASMVDASLTPTAVPETPPQPPEPEPPRAALLTVRVLSTPSHAGVYQDGVRLGETPLTVKVAAGSPFSLILRKDGFHDASLRVDGKKPRLEGNLSKKQARPPPRPKPKDKYKEPTITPQ